MIAGSLAQRYARALLEIGTAQGNYEKLGQELDDLAAAYSASRDLAEALTNPVFPAPGGALSWRRCSRR